MPKSQTYNHNTDSYRNSPGTPQDPSKVSFYSSHVRLFLNLNPIFCRVTPINSAGSNQVTFSLTAFDFQGQQLGIPLVGEFPCPNNCQPPNAFQPLIKDFEASHIRDVLASQPTDSLFDIAIGYVNGNSNDPTYIINSNSYNPSNPTAGGGPRRSQGDAIYISVS